MDIIYGCSGDAIGFVQRDADKVSAFGRRGAFLGWTDGQNVYAHDGSLIAKGEDALGILFQSGDE
jgi:hypothetical protein